MSYGLFEVTGVELEYMIVDADSLAVRPIADTLLAEAAGEPVREWECGALAWCNELARHVIEFKFAQPWPSLTGAAQAFAQQVADANEILARHGAMLLPGAMHPTMDPVADLQLWPLEQQEIYRAYDEIFSCRGHGWANLQSTHINLPFDSDESFTRLHAAIRVVLPLLPALAASSPVMDGKLTGRADNRLFTYRDNAARIPSITGQVVPEVVRSIEEYHARILAPMYADIAPFDPEGILQEDWLNSRGAIARFERQSIEIRVIDIQECPAADLAIVSLVGAVLRGLVEERWCSLAEQHALGTETLADLLMRTAAEAERASLVDSPLPAMLGQSGATEAGRLWLGLAETLDGLAPEVGTFMPAYAQGSLATRIARHLGAGNTLHDTYRALARSLAKNEMFLCAS